MADGPTRVDFTPADVRQLRQVVDVLERNMPDMIELAQMTARMRRAYYCALLAQGFDEAQALYLCSRGGTPLDDIFGRR